MGVSRYEADPFVFVVSFISSAVCYTSINIPPKS